MSKRKIREIHILSGQLFIHTFKKPFYPKNECNNAFI
uniref:Acyl CoA synthetase n=1 Tax=Rhizophora mucronata TaxID=61149 RepID=A0A2P2MKF8_RHIMU